MNEQPQLKTARDFGFRLRAERESQGLTQEELAARSDVSVRWLSNFERGKSPRAELIKVLHVARALGLAFEVNQVREPKLSPEDRALLDAWRDSVNQERAAPRTPTTRIEAYHG
ncbi:MAG: helix-turn-helix transcriptional regulator [Scrofimicrobium sp.]